MYLGLRVYIFTHVTSLWTFSRSPSNDYHDLHIQVCASLRSMCHSPAGAARVLGREEGAGPGRVESNRLDSDSAAGWTLSPLLPTCQSSKNVACEESSSVSSGSAPSAAPLNPHFLQSQRGFSIWNTEGSSSQGLGHFLPPF